MKIVLWHKTYYLTESKYTIGRSYSCDIPIPHDKFLSKIHCSLIRIDDLYRIIDGSVDGKRSKNGIWINDRRVDAALLRGTGCVKLSTLTELFYKSDNRELDTDHDTIG